MCNFAAAMFIKPTKKWRSQEGDSGIMVPYTYYRLCESERGADGKPRQHTVLGLGELLDFPSEADRRELAELLTELIRDGRCRMSYTPGLYDAALGFYGKWIDERREAEQRQDELAEKARRLAEEAKEAKVCLRLRTLRPETARSVGAEHVLLFDLTNMYFEGRMDGSTICRYGRSKEKRNDCKIVGLGAVVNTEGILCRTQIFEGDRQDVTTLEEVIGSLECKGGGKRRTVRGRPRGDKGRHRGQGHETARQGEPQAGPAQPEIPRIREKILRGPHLQ